VIVALLGYAIVFECQVGIVGQKKEVFSQGLEQFLVCHYLFNFLSVVLFVLSLVWHLEGIFEHAFALSAQDQDTCRNREVLVHVLEIINNFLVLNQLGKCPDISNTILINFSLLDMCLIADYVGTI